MDSFYLYLFIYDLLNNTVKSSDRIATNDRTANDWIRKDVEGNGPGIIWGATPEFPWKD
jgi:hypothetical protein